MFHIQLSYSTLGPRQPFNDHVFKQQMFEMLHFYFNNQSIQSQDVLPGMGATIREHTNNENSSENAISMKQNDFPRYNLMFLKGLFNGAELISNKIPKSISLVILSCFSDSFEFTKSFIAKRPTTPCRLPKKSKNYLPCAQWYMKQKAEIPITVVDALENQPLNDDGVPIVVEKCIKFINSYGMLSEGIYRVNGNVYTVDKLMILFKKSPSKMVLKADIYSEYDVASAFKKYMRELSEPLIGNLSEQFKCISRKFHG
jgi:hypothetical protein